MSARIEFLSRMRRKIKAAGYAGEWRDSDGVVTWIPRVDQTAPQIAAAQAIVASYDAAADAAQQLTEERAAANASLTANDGALVRATILTILDEFNLHALKINAILDAVDAATSLTDLKTRVGNIVDYPQRTANQLRTSITNKINAGDADS